MLAARSIQYTCSVTILLCWSVSRLTGQTALSFLPSTDGFSSLTCKQGVCHVLCSSTPHEDIFRAAVMLLYQVKLPQCLKLLDCQCFLLLQLVRPLSALWKRERNFRAEPGRKINTLSSANLWKAGSYLPAGPSVSQWLRHLLGLHYLEHLQRPFSCEINDRERRDVLVNHTFNTPAGQ